MSYEIVYDRQFLKVFIDLEECILPLVLSGSNNTYEVSNSRGRERRAREWGLFKLDKAEFHMRYGIPVMLAYEANDYVENYLPSRYGEHFVRNNKWVNDDGFRRFWKRGVKEALTIEEINERRRYDITVSVLVYKDWKLQEADSFKRCKTSEEISEALKKAGEYKLEFEAAGQNATVSVMYDYEDVLTRDVLKEEYKASRKSTKTVLEKDGEAYVIDSSHGLIRRLSSRSIFHTYFNSDARQFKTAELAKKWISEKLQGRFNQEYIDSLKVKKVGKD